MQFFVDSGDLSEIRTLQDAGLIDGVTTNPSLILKANMPIADLMRDICQVTSGPVSAEVVASDYEGMIQEGSSLASIASNIVVKLPLTLDGLDACRVFSEQGQMTNVTLCFSANQALLTAKAGATYVSPFVGRLDDLNIDGMSLIADIRQIYDNYAFETRILAASIRTANHIREAALLGADAATVPASILRGLLDHPLTQAGVTAARRQRREGGAYGRAAVAGFGRRRRGRGRGRGAPPWLRHCAEGAGRAAQEGLRDAGCTACESKSV